MSVESDEVLCKFYQLFEAGKARDGWFTNADLILKFKSCHHLFRHFHPINDSKLWFGLDHSMTLKAKAPEVLIAKAYIIVCIQHSR